MATGHGGGGVSQLAFNHAALASAGHHVLHGCRSV
jgi:hypothetical protein